MKINTKEKILETATHLFAKNGYNGVSVRAIARAVGITEGSIYNHFVSKEEIMNEILDRHGKELARFMPTNSALIESFEKKGWKPAWATRVEMMEKSPESSDVSIILILANEQYRLPKARHIVMKYYIEEPVRITYELLRHIQSKGKTLPADAMTLARAYQYPIYGMVQEYEMVVSVGEDPAPVLEKIKAHIEFFWKGIMKLDYNA
ncbi:MAG: TetR/AcrR family transcriptional regulator [Clostridiales bacterium]|nr:TetR/AcrR family transcriptional regulator [Clostridiales bacterium]